MPNLKNKLPEVRSDLSNEKRLLKSDLVSFLQHSEGLSSNKAKNIIRKIFQWITYNLATGKKVSIKEFGSFYCGYVRETTTTHPATKKEISIKERVRLIFKPEKKTKSLIQAALGFLRPSSEDDELPLPGKDTKESLERVREELYESHEPNINKMCKKDRAANAPHIVRTSLLTYLKEEFEYELDWIHPITFKRYSSESIFAALKILKEVNERGYRILYASWTSGLTCSMLADRFFYSATTVKRHIEKSLDILVLLLFFPDLHIDLIELKDF